MRTKLTINLFGRAMTAFEIVRHVKRTRGYDLSEQLIYRRHSEGRTDEDLIQRAGGSIGGWREADLEVMRARYPYEDDEGLAADLGRSVSSVKSCAQRHSLKKSRDHTRRKQRTFNGYQQEIVRVPIAGWGCRT